MEKVRVEGTERRGVGERWKRGEDWRGGRDRRREIEGSVYVRRGGGEGEIE